uniref:Uncharacterized protein n=1 Tax=Caenorhabditis japonica TaxID=281687 RepID=A0A8R1EFT0_CAEJA
TLPPRATEKYERISNHTRAGHHPWSEESTENTTSAKRERDRRTSTIPSSGSASQSTLHPDLDPQGHASRRQRQPTQPTREGPQVRLNAAPDLRARLALKPSRTLHPFAPLLIIAPTRSLRLPPDSLSLSPIDDSMRVRSRAPLDSLAITYSIA